MHLSEQLSQRLSKASMEQLAAEAFARPETLAELWNLIENSEGRAADQAGWAWYKIAKSRSDLLDPFVRRMLQVLSSGTSSEAVRRNLLGSLQHTAVDVEDDGLLLDLAFRFLEDRQEPIAVRALSMGILANLVPRYPDLIPELTLILEDLLAHPQTAAIKARARNILKALNRVVK